MKQTLILFLVIQLTVACSYFRKRDSESKDVIARAYEYNLYRDDIVSLIPNGTSKEDSAHIVSNYIDNWLRRKAVLHKAERNLDDEKKDVSRQLDEYRNSLITYAYETELVSQKLDTVISDNEILSFYKSHQENFQLKDNIIKVLYLKLSKKSPKLDKVRTWYRSSSPKDRKELEDYCHQYALNYFLDDDTWLLFDDLLKEIPIKTYDKEQFLQNNRSIEISDSSQIYFVNIKGFMIKNSLSPLSFEKKNIMSMIINERKLKLIEDMERQAFEEGKKSGKVVIEDRLPINN